MYACSLSIHDSVGLVTVLGDYNTHVSVDDMGGRSQSHCTVQSGVSFRNKVSTAILLTLLAPAQVTVRMVEAEYWLNVVVISWSVGSWFIKITTGRDGVQEFLGWLIVS